MSLFRSLLWSAWLNVATNQQGGMTAPWSCRAPCRLQQVHNMNQPAWTGLKHSGQQMLCAVVLTDCFTFQVFCKAWWTTHVSQHIIHTCLCMFHCQLMSLEQVAQRLKTMWGRKGASKTLRTQAQDPEYNITATLQSRGAGTWSSYVCFDT
jgi:hypothetical protein